MSGYGTYTYASGNIYVGNWVNDRRHGQGKMTYKESGKVEEGEWEDGEFIQGSCTWNKGTWKGDVYEGSFEQFKRHGHGTYTWKNGDIYVGNWVNNRRQGQGKMTYKESGKVEEGEWEASKFIG